MRPSPRMQKVVIPSAAEGPASSSRRAAFQGGAHDVPPRHPKPARAVCERCEGSAFLFRLLGGRSFSSDNKAPHTLSFASFASRMLLRDRTQRPGFFLRPFFWAPVYPEGLRESRREDRRPIASRLLRAMNLSCLFFAAANRNFIRTLRLPNPITRRRLFIRPAANSGAINCGTPQLIQQSSPT
jgi:hypothetical protein